MHNISIINVLKKYVAILPAIQIPVHLEELKEKESILSNHRFRLAMIGEFSTGKTTFINSIIGKKILPTRATPCTKQITEIIFQDDEYIEINGDLNSRKPLDVKQLNSAIADEVDRLKISIRSDSNKDFTDFIIFDTPGANDPAELSEDIIFGILGEVDVILFFLDVNQAYKETEKFFISQIVTQKDISKFFFLINFSDTSEEALKVKMDLISNLERDNPDNLKDIKNRVFLISAKKSLEAIMADDHLKLSETGYTILRDSIKNYINENSKKLLEDSFDGFMVDQLIQLKTKAGLLLDQCNGKFQSFHDRLTQLNNEIEGLKESIDEHRQDMTREIEMEKISLKTTLENGLKEIANSIGREINATPATKLINTHPFEMRARKLISDMLEEQFSIFFKKLQDLFTQFDKLTMDKFDRIRLDFGSFQPTSYFKKGIKTAGVAGTAVAVPTLIVSGALSTGLTSLGASALALLGVSAVPVIGGMITPIIAGVGIVCSGALHIAWDVVKATSKKTIELGDKAEKTIGKKFFQKKITDSILGLYTELSIKIDQLSSNSINEAIDQYIENKFPEKKILEQKAELFETQYKSQKEGIEEKKSNLQSFISAIDAELEIRKMI